MSATSPPFDQFPPSQASTDMLLNACRIATVNRNYAGTITYDPLNKYPPNGATTGTIIWAWYRATQGELQTQ